MSGIFHPLQLPVNKGDNYVDGGTTELLPIGATIELRAKNIIAVATDREKMKPMLSSTANIIDILKRSLLDILLDETLKK